MALEEKRQRKPAIILTRTDHERLYRLAEAHAGRNSDVSEELLIELDRARLVPDAKIGANVARMGSRIRFTTDLGEDRSVTLVFPAEADIAANKISILTPIGVALIGLSAGQSINWVARDGRLHRLHVEEVASPEGIDLT